MNRFKTFNGFSIDRINYADVPPQKHQKRIDAPPSNNLIKIDEWSAPIVPCPENGSPDTYRELQRMANEISLIDDDTQEEIIEKYDDLFTEFKKICKKELLIFPKKYMEDLVNEAGEIIIKLKYKYNRPRPFQLAPILGINLRSDIVDSANTPSFPSGHACQGKLVANVLSEMYPEYAEKFKQIAEQISYSRYIGGVHFPSDLVYGEELADWMVNYVVFPDQIDESKTIGKTNDIPNISPNDVLKGDDEDERLMKIRQFKGNVEDYKGYWNDRIDKGNI
jgi:hypothetical protein